MEQKKSGGNERGWRDKPVEEEADKDIKQGGMEGNAPEDTAGNRPDADRRGGRQGSPARMIDHGGIFR